MLSPIPLEKILPTKEELRKKLDPQLPLQIQQQIDNSNKP
jgi:hypothetical protein